jgi:hypothetical protein
MAELRYDTWKRSPEEALQRAFDEHMERVPWPGKHDQSAFLWQSLKGKGENTTYGSFQTIRKNSLEGRKYEIQFWDGQVTIHWLDVVHNARAPWPNRNEWIDEDREGWPPKC